VARHQIGPHFGIKSATDFSAMSVPDVIFHKDLIMGAHRNETNRGRAVQDR
jgi:hypothetical protein